MPSGREEGQRLRSSKTPAREHIWWSGPILEGRVSGEPSLVLGRVEHLIQDRLDDRPPISGTQNQRCARLYLKRGMSRRCRIAQYAQTPEGTKSARGIRASQTASGASRSGPRRAATH